MKPEELRILNWVYDSFENREVLVWGIESNHDQITVNYANGSKVYREDLKHITPIKLTEDWLLKFGFESNKVSYKIDNNKFIFELYFYDAWNLNYIEKHKFGNGNVELSGYWKIHELQNLYFALSGEELTIKNE